MNNYKQIVMTALFTICLLFAVNCLASNYIEDAEQYYKKGEFKAAIIQLKNQLKEKPQDAQARLFLGKIHLTMGNFKQADKEISRAYQLDQSSDDIVLTYAELLLTQRKYKKLNEILNNKFSDPEKENQRQIYNAYAYLGRNQLGEAKHILSDLMKKEEGNVQVYNGLAMLALVEKDYDEVRKWLNESIKKEPENTKTLQIEVNLLIVQKKYDNVLKIYNKLLKKSPDNLAFYLKRSAVKLQLKDMAGAESDAQNVLNKVNNQPNANYLLAQINLEQKHYKKAINAAQNVLNVLPNSHSAMLIIGIAQFAQGNFNQADKYLTQYLSVYPENLNVQNLLANIYLAQKNGEQAILILEGIEQQKRNKNAQILTTLGSAYLLAGEHQKGLEILNKARLLDPESYLIQKQLVVGQMKVGDIDSAILGLEQIVDYPQVNKEIQYLLIVSYIQQKQLQKAEDHLKVMMQKMPNDPGLYNLQAVLEQSKENNENAKIAFHKAIDIDDQYIPAYIGLAELASSQQDLSAAKKYYSKVIQVNSKYIKAYIYLAAIAEKENNVHEVEQQLKTALDQVKGNLNSQVRVAGLLSKWYIKQQTPEKIMPIAQNLNRQYLNNNTALSFLALAQIANKEDGKAQQTLRRIIITNGRDVKHRLLLVSILLKNQSNDNDIMTLLNELIALVPESSRPVVIKSAYLLKNKRYQQVLELADYAQKKFPEKSLGDQLKGDIYFIKKQYEFALKHYRAAYKIAQQETFLFAITDILIIQGQHKNALELLQSESKNKEKSLTFHFKLASLYQVKKEYNKSAEHYKKMLEIKEDHILAMNNLAWVYLQQNNPEALILAQKAYEKKPESAAIIDTYGYIQVKLGSVDIGVQLLEKAVALSPKAYDIKYHLAEGYHSNGNNKQASALLNSILKDNIEFPEKNNAQKLFNQLQ